MCEVARYARDFQAKILIQQYPTRLIVTTQFVCPVADDSAPLLVKHLLETTEKGFFWL